MAKGTQTKGAQLTCFDQDQTLTDAKGRLLTTPNRLLKLILPLPSTAGKDTIHRQSSDSTIEHSVTPLALLIHPSQPLSYLERLIQAEVPPIQVKDKEKSPDVVFFAEADSEAMPEKDSTRATNIASYSGLGHEGPDRKEASWVRWSGSTEVGDFIRDAARGREFAVDIEGRPEPLLVAVPSFKDRTHYMRMRLRRMSLQIDQMSKLKTECDELAHKGAHHLAKGGFGALVGWWGTVFYVTFFTEMGWDMIEPITYLAGLTTIMGGYLWFLFISRDLSYRAAMNMTVSKRQSVLYQDRGFNVAKWEALAQEANGLRREVRNIAAEYDVEWDEMKDLGGWEVKEALEKEENGEDEEDGESGKKKKKKQEEKSTKRNQESEEKRRNKKTDP